MHALATRSPLLLLLACLPARADALYQASVITTGMDMRSRPAGISEALPRVLAAVSGNPAWLTDPRVAALDATPLLGAIAYVDRESDQPKHDEQGSRDRPYDLVVTFNPVAVDAQLRAWGDTPWARPRPMLVVDVAITPRAGSAAPLRADTDGDERHRGALLAAASRFGMDIWLPAINAPPPSPAGAPVLQGTVVWSDSAFGWVSQWHLVRDGQQVGPGWGLSGVGFDVAYRDGIAGAVKTLSGH